MIFKPLPDYIKLPNRVYYVSSPHDETVLLAMLTQHNGSIIRWFDSVKERCMYIKKIMVNNENQFEFERADDEGGGVYTFTPVTLEIFNTHIKSRLLSPQQFDDKEKLLQTLEDTINSAW